MLLITVHFEGIIGHSNYLGKELWISFYDIKKCFDSRWLGLYKFIIELWCTKSYLVPHLSNRNADIIVKTSFGDTEAFMVLNLVKQGTVLGPMLNNCLFGEILTMVKITVWGGEGIPARICWRYC